MAAIFNAFSPVLLIVALGFLAFRRELLPKAMLPGLNSLAFYCLMPCLLFLSVQRADLSHIDLTLLSFFTPVVVLFAIWAWRTDASHALAANFSNNVLIALPILANWLGPQSTGIAVTVIAFHSLTLFSLFALAQVVKQQPTTASVAWYNAVLHPMVIAVFCGLIANLTGTSLPSIIEHSLEMVAQGAFVAGLLCLAGNFANQATFLAMPTPSAWLILINKHLLLPLLVFSCGWLFGLPPHYIQVLTLMAASPIGVNVLPFLLAGRQLGANLIVQSTLLAVITMPMIMAMLDIWN